MRSTVPKAVRQMSFKRSVPLQKVELISCTDMFALTKKPETHKDIQVVDVREKDELVNVHIKGIDFKNLPLSEIDNWCTDEKVCNLLDKSKTIVCYCRRGVRSMKVANALDAKGFKVLSLDGGIEKYATVDPTVGTY